MKLKKRTRQDIINDLNKPTYIEQKQMEKDGLTWEKLRQKLGIKVYK